MCMCSLSKRRGRTPGYAEALQARPRYRPRGYFVARRRRKYSWMAETYSIFSGVSAGMRECARLLA